MVQPGRFERPTSSFAGKRSIQTELWLLAKFSEAAQPYQKDARPASPDPRAHTA